MKNTELPMSNVLHIYRMTYKTYDMQEYIFVHPEERFARKPLFGIFLFHLIPIGNIKHLDFQSFNIVGANFSILRKFVFCILIFRPYLCNFNFINSQRLDYEQDKRQQSACGCGKKTTTGSISDKRGVHPCWHYLVQGG